MTTQQLLINWKTYGIILDSDKKKIHPLEDIFMLCWGIGKFNGKKVLLFDKGGDQGAHAFICYTNKKNQCIQGGFNDKTKKFVFVKVGRFVKLKKKNLSKKKK